MKWKLPFSNKARKKPEHAHRTRQKVAEALARLLFEREQSLNLERLRSMDEEDRLG